MTEKIYERCKFCGGNAAKSDERFGDCHPKARFEQARIAAWTKFAGAALQRPSEEGTPTVDGAVFLADQMLEEWDKRFKN